MNRKQIKAAVAVLTAGLTVATIYAPVNLAWAGAGNEKEDKDIREVVEEKKEEMTGYVKKSLNERERADKDETVYVIANADGSAAKVIVSDRLENRDGKKEIEDISDLKNIKNVKGRESFTRDGEKITWNAEGNEIVYRGESDRELPVDLHVTYTLDGKSITADELAGKSGHVEMTYEFNNKEKAPFAAVTVLLLNNDDFKNITVKGGSVSSDGSRSTVFGIAFPGLGDELKSIDADCDRIVIEADTTDFKLLTSLTVVTDEVFRGLYTEDGRDRNEIDQKLKKVEKDCGELIKGTAALAGAMNELSDGTAKLNTAVGQLGAGAKQLTANNGTLVAGSEQIFDSILKSAYGSLTAAGVTIPELTRENYGTVLEGAVTSMSAQLKYIPEGTETYVKVQTGIGTLNAVKAQLDSVNAFCTGLKTYTDGVSLLEANLSKLSEETLKLDEAVKQIRDGAVVLADSVEDADLDGMVSGVRSALSEIEASSDRLQALLKEADGYNNFSGLAEGQTGSVRFIYRTASIGE